MRHGTNTRCGFGDTFGRLYCLLGEAYRKFPKLVPIALLLLSSAPARAALDPAEALTQYTQDVWGKGAGLPHDWVLAIAQTPDGYLWLGTEEGLARFDGVRFTIFDRKNTPAIQSNHISALLVDSHKNLWIGTEGGGLTEFRNGQFVTYTTRNGLSNDVILSLHEDRKGVLWIGTNGGGLCRFQGGTFKTYTSKNGLPDNAVFALDGDRHGGLWIGTHAGLAELKNGQITTYTTKNGLSNNYVKCLHVSRGGDVWIGTNGGGLSHFINGRFITYGTDDGLSSTTVWSIYEDSAGTLWIGTFDSGLNRFRAGKFTAYGPKDGFPAKGALAFLEDREGSFWIGTGGAGLVRLKRGSFTVTTTHEGLSNDVVLPVYEDREGAIWAGTNGGGLNRIKDGHITTYTTRNGLSDNVVFSIAEDNEGSLWVATHKGLDRLKNGQFAVFGRRNGLPDAYVMCLYRDRQGVLWAGSRAGLSRFDGVSFHTYTTYDGLSSNYVVSLYEDQQNTLWIGTGGGGLNKLSKGRFSSYTTRNGLSSNTIWSLAGDAGGTLWIGTSGGGLDRLKGGKFTAYTTRDGLFDDEILQILSDRRGYLWMSSNRGVFRVAKSQLNAYAEGHVVSITPKVFGTSDGLKDKECNGGFQPAGWQTKDGRLLFPTMKGLAAIDPERLRTNPVPPPVAIEKVEVDGLNFDPAKAIQAKPGQGRLEFGFTALSLVSSDNIRFKYKLEGFDKDWIDAGPRRVAYYTNIPPGTYRFTVIACNNDGVWNDTGASLLLTLSPHFYQSWIFIVLCAGLLAGMCVGAYRLRIQHLKTNEKRLVGLVEERTQELQEQIRARERAHAELAEAQQHLIELSRLSGMAEVATGVLHNVGNVLNSINVGASVISAKVAGSRLDNLSAAINMLQEHAPELPRFLETDAKGQRILPYLVRLASHLQNERSQVLSELKTLTNHIDHIKEIVATQQDYARVSPLVEAVSIPELVEDALRMVKASLDRHHVEVICEIGEVPEIVSAKRQILDILVNLLRNAKQAVIEQNGPLRQITICVRRQADDRIRIEVNDTGVGLAQGNLTRIFAHGFTTKRNGHGFGLHSGAVAARQMHGALWAESGGPGLGTKFVLELPAKAEAAVPEMITA